MASAVAFVKAIYSDFMDDKATNCCFLLLQEITPSTNKKQNIKVEWQVSLPLIQLASK